MNTGKARESRDLLELDSEYISELEELLVFIPVEELEELSFEEEEDVLVEDVLVEEVLNSSVIITIMHLITLLV